MSASAAKVTPIASKRQPHAGEFLLGRHWAMLPERLHAMRSLAVQTLTNPAALTAWADAGAPNTFMATMRDGIATLRINGPMCRTWDFWAWVFGFTPYEVLAKDLTQLKNDASVRAIILSGDTPGGEVQGCHEMAAVIAEVNRVKPVIWHGAGLTCSAGYWLAAATRRIVVDRVGITGSIGTCYTHYDPTGMYKQLGVEVIEMVSSQSPLKNLKPTTKSGRANWQRTLDSMAGVMIADIAAYRDTDERTVLTSYGRGDVFVGAEAVDAGLADAVGTDEEVRAELVAQLNDESLEPELIMAAKPKTKKITGRRTLAKARVAAATAKADLAAAEAAAVEAEAASLLDTSAEYEDGDDEEEEEDVEAADESGDDEEEEKEKAKGKAEKARPKATSDDASALATAVAAVAPDVAAAIRAEGATAERARILAIHGLTAKVGANAKAQKAIVTAMADPKATKASVAESLLDGGVLAGAAALAAREGDENELDPPANAGTGAAAGSVDAVADTILNAGRSTKR